MEVELKLSLPADHMPHLQGHPMWDRLICGDLTEQALESTYFDTQTFDLTQSGISLRLRRTPHGYVQTVKTSGQRSLGMFSRHEWEWPVSGESINHAVLSEIDIPLLQDAAIMAAIRPIFATKIQRTTRVIQGADWSVEIAFDQGEIQSGEQSLAVSEVELELQSGSPACLFELAGQIAERFPARLQHHSKSDRGFQLSRGLTPSPAKSKLPAITPDLTTGDGLQVIGRACLSHLLANERSLIEHHDPEAVHQMRVALRRFRSALKLFRPVLSPDSVQELLVDIRWLLGHLGPARDADVLMDEIITPARQALPQNQALAHFAQDWRTMRDQAFSLAVCSVAEPRFTRMAIALGQWLENADWKATQPALSTRPLRDYAVKVLRKGRKKMLRLGGKSLLSLPPEQRHQIRILGKQVRYASEFFAPLFTGSSHSSFIALLCELQDQLGQLNDIMVARQQLGKTTATSGHGWATGFILGWHDSREPDLLHQAEKTWKKLRKQDAFSTR